MRWPSISDATLLKARVSDARAHNNSTGCVVINMLLCTEDTRDLLFDCIDTPTLRTALARVCTSLRQVLAKDPSPSRCCSAFRK